MYHILAIYPKGSEINLKIPIAGLLIGILVACRETKPNSTVPSIPKQQQAPQSQPEVKQPLLSSSAPSKVEAFPSSKVPGNSGADSSQLKAHDSETEAMFKREKINVDVMKVAQLSPEQAKALIGLTNRNTHGWKFRIILPTYVPKGFHIDRVEVSDMKGVGMSPSYGISYRNANNKCFSISGFQISGAGPEKYDNSTEIISPLLGKVVLTRTSFNQSSKGSLIHFQNPIRRGDLTYEVSSYTAKSCNTIAITEVAKIVKSLQYLEKRTAEQEASRKVTTVPVQYRSGDWYEKSTIFVKNYRFDFPQKSCGDTRSQKNLEHKNNWYSVFVDAKSTYDLERVRNYKCKDASLVVRKKTGKPAILVASFASYKKAIEFAKLVQGEVGKP